MNGQTNEDRPPDTATRRQGPAVLRWIERGEAVAGGLLVVVIFALILTQAAQRYLPVDGWVWTGELARFGLVWLTFSVAGSLAACGGGGGDDDATGGGGDSVTLALREQLHHRAPPPPVRHPGRRGRHQRPGPRDAAYAFDDADHLFEFFDSDASERLEADFAEATGMQILDVWYFGDRHFTANQPITAPDDLQGLRMRFPDSPIYLENAKALGASATAVAFEEVFLALQQGIVDGQENPIPTIAENSFDEVQSDLSLTGHQVGSQMIVVSSDAWDGLAPEQQESLQEAVTETREEDRQCIEEAEEEILSGWEDTVDITVNELDKEPFQEQARGYFEENLSGAPLELWNAIRESAADPCGTPGPRVGRPGPPTHDLLGQKEPSMTRPSTATNGAGHDARRRIAVVGAGLIGRRHIGLTASGDRTELVAVVDPGEGAASLARSAGVPCFGALDDLLAGDRPDGVIVATPNHLHVEQAVTCLRAGVPVLVEKPVADTLERAQVLVDAAEACGVPVLVGHHRRHSPLLGVARDVVGSGRLGDVVAVSGSTVFRKPEAYFEAAPWCTRTGAGPVLVNLVHEIDALRFLCGDITWVHATASHRARGFEVEDTAAVTLRFAGGALGSYLLSDAAVSARSWEQTSGEDPAFPHYADEDCYVVSGSRGSLSAPTMRLREHTGTPSWWTPTTDSVLPVEQVDPLAAPLEHFAEVIAGAPPLVSAADATESLRVTLAVAQSAATGAGVDLPRRGDVHAPTDTDTDTREARS